MSTDAPLGIRVNNTLDSQDNVSVIHAFHWRSSVYHTGQHAITIFIIISVGIITELR